MAAKNEAVEKTAAVKVDGAVKAEVKPEAKKPAAKKPVAKKPEAKKSEEKKPEIKKTEAKKPVAKKTEVKKPEAKKETAKKEKAPAKKAAAGKKTAVQFDIHVQYAGKSYSQEDLIKIAKDVWQYDMNMKAEDFKAVEVYVKPEENIAYFVVNGEFQGSFVL